MFIESVEQIPAQVPATDRVLVIGAGAVGLYAASLLARQRHNVVVIESGEAHLGNFSTDAYSVVGRPHSGIRIGRSRNLGGTTSLWGGQLVEFQPSDLNGREWIPRSKWPVSFEELAPYYRPTYQNLGTPLEWVDDDAVWKAVNTPKPELGEDFEVFFTRWMRVPNFAELFAGQMQSDERLMVLSGHTAVGFRGEGARLNAVRVVDREKRTHWIEGGIVILAAGTIENARLMLHAAQDECWPVPWRGNRNVGRFFQDHLGGRLGAFYPNDRKKFFRQFSNVVNAGYKFQPKVRMTMAAQARARVLNTQAFFSFESEISEHMVYLKQFLRAAMYSRKISSPGDVLRKCGGVVQYLFPLMWKYAWEHRVFVPSSSKIFLTHQSEQGAIEESVIRIDPAHVDENGVSRAVLDWQLGAGEFASIREFAVELGAALEQSGIGRLEMDPELLARDPRYLARVGDTYHQTGGTLMAETASAGVVDRNLRVFGTDNMYVAGAGVFPTNSNANVTFTAITFVTRLVEHLAGSVLPAAK